jgi:hypothetical protein
MPDQRGLADICAVGSILILLAGMKALDAERGNGSAGRWFALAGIVGGLGMWVSVQKQVPIAAGIAIGALLAARVRPRGLAGPDVRGVLHAKLWRIWAWSGGATVLLAYLAEYAPDHMGGWRMDSIHPLYALAWIGAGELLARAVAAHPGHEAVLGVSAAFWSRRWPLAPLRFRPLSCGARRTWGFLAQGRVVGSPELGFPEVRRRRAPVPGCSVMEPRPRHGRPSCP